MALGLINAKGFWLAKTLVWGLKEQEGLHWAHKPLHLACAPAHVGRLARTPRRWRTSRPACRMPQLRRSHARFHSGAHVRCAAPAPTPRQSWPRLRIARRFVSPLTTLASKEASHHQDGAAQMFTFCLKVATHQCQ